MKNKESLVHQRSRVREGDANSKFFHACIKSRFANNQISELLDGNRWIDDVQGIRSVATKYFSEHFSENKWIRPRLDGVIFQTVSARQNEMLVEMFCCEEIKDT